MTDNMYFHQTGRDHVYKTWHAHDNIMILRTYSDGGNIAVRGKVYPIASNTICLVGADRYHYTMPDEPEIYDRSKIFISKDDFSLIRKLISADSFKNTFAEDSFIYARLDDDSIRLADELFDEVYKACSKNEYSSSVMLASFIRFIALIDKCSVESVSSVGFMGKAIEFIGNNIETELDIDTICNAIHMSKFYFCRKFKEHTGMTVMNYILETRLMMAKEMLAKKKTSVSEISDKCGFSSISYFCQVFKEHTGKTPLKYRKDCSEKD